MGVGLVTCMQPSARGFRLPGPQRSVGRREVADQRDRAGRKPCAVVALLAVLTCELAADLGLLLGCADRQDKAEA